MAKTKEEQVAANNEACKRYRKRRGISVAMFGRSLRRAREKKVPHRIVVKDIDEAWKASGGVCPVYGVPLQKSDSGHGQYQSPTLICIDSNRGYIRGNIMVVSFKAKDHHFTADSPASFVSDTPSIYDTIFDFAEDRAVRKDFTPDGPGQFSLRYNKAKVRSSVYSSPIPAFGRALILPGTDLMDVMIGLKNHIFNDTTRFVMVENNPESVKMIKGRYTAEDSSITKVDRWLDKYVGRRQVTISHDDRFTLLEKPLDSVSSDDLAGDDIDFVNLDTCNVYTEKLHRLLSEVVYPQLAKSCSVSLVLVDRYGGGSYWHSHAAQPMELKAREWTREQVQKALPDLTLTQEHVYDDQGRMWVLRFARGVHLKMYELEKMLMAELTDKQQMLYSSLPTPGQKAHYRRELENGANAHEKQNITRKYLKEMGCTNFADLKNKIRKISLG